MRGRLAIAAGDIAELRETLERHPEWWTACLAAMAAIFLVAQAVSTESIALCPTSSATGRSEELQLVAIVVATMLPLVLVPVRRTAQASLWRRRHRAIAGFLLGYGGVWALTMAGETILAGWLPAYAWLPAAAFAVAALWEMTPLKRRALSICHATQPLRPFGWRADWDCLRYGMRHARACTASCWAIMLAPMLVAPQLPLLAGASTLCALGRYWPRRWQRLEAVTLAVAALSWSAAPFASPILHEVQHITGLLRP